MKTLAAAVALLAGCEGATEVAMPQFAAELPGDVAVVVWSDREPLAAERIAELDRVAIAAELDVVAREPSVWAARVEGARTGWATLADSTLFRAAIATAADAPLRIFIDLQQVVDAVLRRVDSRIQRLTDVVALDGLEYAMASAALDGDRVSIDARVAGSGSLFDVLGDGRAAARAPALLAAASDDELRVDAVFVPAEVAVALRRSAGSSGPFDGMMTGMTAAFTGTAAKLAETVWDGTFAVRFGPSGFRMALGVVDRERAAELIGKVFPAGESGEFRMPGELMMLLGDDRLDVTSGEEMTPTVGEPWAASGVVARGRAGGASWSMSAVAESGGLRVRIDRR